MRRKNKVAIIGDLRAEDDFTHPVKPMQSFSETNLFYYVGETSSGKITGGIIRVANKPNQGCSDATILYFPGDGSALFKFERPKIVDQKTWKVSGWDLNVVTPGGIEFNSVYQGDALHLKDPRLLATPKIAFQQPKLDLALELTHFGKSPMTEFRYNKEIDDPDKQGIAGTKGLHQLTSFTGTVAIGGEPSESINGYGWRDHNWGPRNWQIFPRHAFYTGNFNEEKGFVLFKTEGGLGYFMHEGPDQIFEVIALDMSTTYAEDGREPVCMRAKITLNNGNTHVVEGQKLDFIPLRNRRENMTTHLGYSLWKYQLDGELEGYGIAEHLSQSKTHGAGHE